MTVIVITALAKKTHNSPLKIVQFNMWWAITISNATLGLGMQRENITIQSYYCVVIIILQEE